MELCRARGVAADAMEVSDETLTLVLADGALCEATSRESHGASLRVFTGGAVGWAGASQGAALPGEVLEAALLSAASGPQVEVHLPVAAPLPSVLTSDDDAATVPLPDLEHLGAGLTARLQGADRRVQVTLERALGEVAVANSRGVEASYATTLAAVGVEVQVSTGDGVLSIRDAVAVAALPTDAELDALVADIEQRLLWGRRPGTPPRTIAPVIIMPRALRQVLRPVEQALLAGESTASPLSGALGEQRFSPVVHLADAPLLPGRPGSRPIDDDGVVTQHQWLVEAGVVRRLLCDLVTGARLRRPSTGSARRTVFGTSRPGFSNLVLEAGTRSMPALLATLGDGLLVDEVTTGAGAVAAGGGFRFPVASGFRVEGGEVVGRVEGVAVSGNAFDVLARVLDVGSERRWVGSALLPPLLVEGIEVGAR